MSRPLTVDWGVKAPLSIAAVAVRTLKVEPGAYPNCVARLTSGLPGEPASSASCAFGERSALGLKLGEEAITCTAPVRG